ncbi:MAG: hypothetical protein JWM27_317 [Gemmatimonadetes bacterium]|nr:hypothetical protein [Gemmatimonadota bacterium]
MKESLNLSLESSSIDRGRRYSKRHATSISKLVDAFLASLPADDAEDEQLTPTVRRLLGIAATHEPVGIDDYHRYLEDKYGA